MYVSNKITYFGKTTCNIENKKICFYVAYDKEIKVFEINK